MAYELLQENPAFVANAMAYERAVEALFCGRCSLGNCSATVIPSDRK